MRVKKIIRKKKSNSIVGIKKGFYICTRLSDELLKKREETSSLTY